VKAYTPIHFALRSGIIYCYAQVSNPERRRRQRGSADGVASISNAANSDDRDRYRIEGFERTQRRSTARGSAMSFQFDLLIHVANVLYLLAFMVRDILWLRILAVVATACLVPYFYFRPEPLMTPIYWNLVFAVLNIYWICRLLLERLPVKLSADEQRLCELVFRTMTPREMTKLLKLASWESAETGECFVERDKPLDRLMVIYSGKACAEVDGRNVAELRPGHFIGSISYVTEEMAPANVVAIEATRYVSWPKSKLKDFMSKNPDLHSALKSTLAIDLTRWLQATWARGASQNATRTDPV
jgi:CRP-like cAMP-binding protein